MTGTEQPNQFPKDPLEDLPKELPKELPLAGVRVIEMTHMVMGPTCGMILAQLGAEVIKVEPPAGDKTRSLGGMGTSFFPLFNRGKRSVVLDFEKQQDRDFMHDLLAGADVFLENFRDGQLDRQGLGAEELRKKYPHLIIAGHKGFMSGPYEHRPALDEVVQMMSGLAAMTGTRDKPQRVGSSANDIMGGMFGVISILAALYQRRSGAASAGGADIRIGLFENCLFLVAQHMVEYEMTGNKPRSMPEREHAWPIYDIFDTAGGERIFIGVVTEGHWQSFCREFGLKEFSEDQSLRTTTDRIMARSRILPRVAEEIRRCDVAELSARLDRLNICFSPINRPEDLLTDPHVLRPGGLVNNTNANGRAFRVPALPIEWNGSNLGEGLKVPVLGADTETVRAELEQEKSAALGKVAGRHA
jgi:crotonobetainyl-CoA:carnitine CoA-transferase CaiB-like acyl-CoA transferase